MESSNTEIVPKNPRVKVPFNFAKRPANNMNMRRNDKVIPLVCNMMQLTFDNVKNIKQFAISINPTIGEDNSTLRKKVIRSLGKELKGYFEPYIVSGYTLFSSTTHPESKITMETNVDNVDYSVQITLTKNKLELKQVNEVNDECRKIKSLMEIIIKNIIEANDHLVYFDQKGSFYSFKNKVKLSDREGFSLPGFSTAACITQSGLLLRVTDKKKMITGRTASDKLKELKAKYENGNFHKAAQDYFERTTVLANYGSHRAYQISGITFDKTPSNMELTIKEKDGTERSVQLADYYSMQYKIVIKDKSQPLLLNYPDKKNHPEKVIYLVPELCLITSMDDDDENEQGGKMKRGDKLKPKQKLENCLNVKHLLYSKEKKTINKPSGQDLQSFSPEDIRDKWGINFKDFVVFQGRELLPPEMKFKQDSVKAIKGRFRYSKALNPTVFDENSWIVICSTNSEQNVVNNGIESIKKASNSLGIPVKTPKIHALPARNANDFVDQMRKIDLNNGKKLALIFLSGDRREKGWYSSIKDYLYNEVGLPSQNILIERNNRNKTSLSYFSNVLSQMVVKTRGEPYSIFLDNMFNKNPTMIIGIDSSKGGKEKRKVIMTSSFNPNMSKFITQQRICENKDFDITLQDMLKTSLDKFKTINNCLPKFSIIYRQGGNDKMKEKIYQDELPIFQKMFEGKEEGKCYQKDYSAKIAFISVNKKSELKFFQKVRSNDVDNPPNGTCIDTEITQPGNFEFYLQPQFVNQGTATPVYYHCLYENMGIPIEILEKVTHNMTYYYWNWPGPIREPAALKFAEVCNSFTSKYFRNNFCKESLVDTPFYI